MNEHLFYTLRELSNNGSVSQRELSKRIGVSLGKINYLINELLKKGYIKTQRFMNSKNRVAYMYLLTPKGITEKARQTRKFLQRKSEEYERLREEIEILKLESREQSFNIEHRT